MRIQEHFWVPLITAPTLKKASAVIKKVPAGKKCLLANQDNNKLSHVLLANWLTIQNNNLSHVSLANQLIIRIDKLGLAS